MNSLALASFLVVGLAVLCITLVVTRQQNQIDRLINALVVKNGQEMVALDRTKIIPERKLPRNDEYTTDFPDSPVRPLGFE